MTPPEIVDTLYKILWHFEYPVHYAIDDGNVGDIERLVEEGIRDICSLILNIDPSQSSSHKAAIKEE